MRLEASGMKFLRNMAGYRRADDKREDEITEEFNILEPNDKGTHYRNI
jgi:hypothetical protein